MSVIGDDYRYGSYLILYRLFYVKYPDVVVEQTVPFTIDVVDPCGNEVDNSLTSPVLETQVYTITDNP